MRRTFSHNNIRETGRAAVKFSTFAGVFTPSLLTILGVVMFLRFNTVVGHAGLWRALAILAIAKAITLTTALSLSSISTNMRVKAGGPYYMISRSLGVEFGGVIAAFYYIAQTVSVAMYVIGLTETIVAAFPALLPYYREIATLINLVTFLCVLIGAGWTIRVQYAILAIVGLALLSFVVGALLGFSPEILRANLTPAWSEKYNFFTTFALFFASVVGIMTGVNMSGDLKDPRRSIPMGTLGAILVSGVIYLLLLFLLAASVSRGTLLGDTLVMHDRAIWGPLVYGGLFAGALASALASMMGAPRILQAFARDQIFRPFNLFARGSGPSNEPRRAIILTFVIAQIGVYTSDLNTLAPLISLFFLITYGTVNLACFYEIFSRNPSFRPTFRFNHWSVALAGALGCLGVMLLSSPWLTILAITIAAGFYMLIARAKIRVNWGDVDGGVAYQRARSALLRLERGDYHPKNWRPSILALSGGAYNRAHLTAYATWLTRKNGVVSLAQVIHGNLDTLLDRQREAEALLRKFIREEGFAAFPVVVVDENIHRAVQALLQCHGLGSLRPNTLLLGWSRDLNKADTFVGLLRLVRRMGRSLVVVANKSRAEDQHAHIPEGVINVWWSDDHNGPLMLLLAFLLRQNKGWRDRPLRIIRTLPPRGDVEGVTATMRAMMLEARITAELVVVATDDQLAAVNAHLKPAAVLFTGFEPPTDGNSATLAKLAPIAALPCDVIFVYSAGDVSIME